MSLTDQMHEALTRINAVAPDIVAGADLLGNARTALKIVDATRAVAAALERARKESHATQMASLYQDEAELSHLVSHRLMQRGDTDAASAAQMSSADMAARARYLMGVDDVTN